MLNMVGQLNVRLCGSDTNLHVYGDTDLYGDTMQVSISSSKICNMLTVHGILESFHTNKGQSRSHILSYVYWRTGNETNEGLAPAHLVPASFPGSCA